MLFLLSWNMLCAISHTIWKMRNSRMTFVLNMLCNQFHPSSLRRYQQFSSIKTVLDSNLSQLLLFQNIAAFQTSVATSNIESTTAHSDSRCHQYLLGVLSGEAWCLMLRLRIGTFSQTPRDPAPFVLFLLPLCLWPEWKIKSSTTRENN